LGVCTAFQMPTVDCWLSCVQSLAPSSSGSLSEIGKISNELLLGNRCCIRGSACDLMMGKLLLLLCVVFGYLVRSQARVLKGSIKGSADQYFAFLGDFAFSYDTSGATVGTVQGSFTVAVRVSLSLYMSFSLFLQEVTHSTFLPVVSSYSHPCGSPPPVSLSRVCRIRCTTMTTKSRLGLLFGTLVLWTAQMLSPPQIRTTDFLMDTK
jgi:hypothetical protein